MLNITAFQFNDIQLSCQIDQCSATIQASRDTDTIHSFGLPALDNEKRHTHPLLQPISYFLTATCTQEGVKMHSGPGFVC